MRIAETEGAYKNQIIIAFENWPVAMEEKDAEKHLLRINRK